MFQADLLLQIRLKVSLAHGRLTSTAGTIGWVVVSGMVAPVLRVAIAGMVAAQTELLKVGSIFNLQFSIFNLSLTLPSLLQKCSFLGPLEKVGSEQKGGAHIPSPRRGGGGVG